MEKSKTKKSKWPEHRMVKRLDTYEDGLWERFCKVIPEEPVPEMPSGGIVIGSFPPAPDGGEEMESDTDEEESEEESEGELSDIRIQGSDEESEDDDDHSQFPPE